MAPEPDGKREAARLWKENSKQKDKLERENDEHYSRISRNYQSGTNEQRIDLLLEGRALLLAPSPFGLPITLLWQNAASNTKEGFAKSELSDHLWLDTLSFCCFSLFSCEVLTWPLVARREPRWSAVISWSLVWTNAYEWRAATTRRKGTEVILYDRLNIFPFYFFFFQLF